MSAMILKLLLFISFFDSFCLIHVNQQFHFGIINHHTQWYFHCPRNNIKMLTPPSNDPPLISYECPFPSLAIEILPIEIDFTFLCRLESRLIWFIIDLYQYNTFLSVINNKDIEIKLELNNKIQLNNYTSEIDNLRNRFILINAFYIPFESIDILLNEQIEINIEIKNVNQLNQCHFSLKDNYLWQTFINNNCDSVQSNTIFIQSAKCHFYPTFTSESVDTNLQVHVADEIILTTPDDNLPDFNLVLSIDQEQRTTTECYNSTQNINLLTTETVSYYRDYLLLEKTYREMFASAIRSIPNPILLKLIFIFLVLILILLILFFLYMIYYHDHIRLRSSSLIRRPSVLV